MNKAIFLDRDGTLIADRGYLDDPAGVELLPDVVESLRKLQGEGYLLIVVSNQSAIARGYCPVEQVEAVNAAMVSMFAKEGVVIDGVYYCPHGPEEGCECRKPRPGLLLKAAGAHDIDLGRSVMIGDAMRDVLSGQAAGCPINILLAEDGARDWEPTARGFGEVTAILCAEESPKP